MTRLQIHRHAEVRGDGRQLGDDNGGKRDAFARSALERTAAALARHQDLFDAHGARQRLEDTDEALSLALERDRVAEARDVDGQGQAILAVTCPRPCGASR